MSTPPRRPEPSHINLRGAVDLAALRGRQDAAASAGGSGGPGGPGAPGQPAQGAPGRFVVEANEQSFGELVPLSAKVPVVISLWAAWSEASIQLNDVLGKVVAEQAGRVLLATVDIDAGPQIAQAFQVQSVPAVVALLKGQPVPLFQGMLPEEQVRGFIDELLKVAEANGVNGSLGEAPAEGAEAEPEPLPPLHQEAFDAIEAGDYAAAADAYRRALAERPADDDARTGLAQVELMRRLDGLDGDAVRAEAAANPDSLDAQLAVADLDVAGGHVEDAFARLVGFVAGSSGDRKEAARARLVELFDVVGPADPRVTKARAALARALF